MAAVGGTQSRSIASSNVGQRNKRHVIKKSPRSMYRGIQGDKKPTATVANALPLSYQEMDNATLVTLGNLGEHGACREMLKRHIMDVDSCDYDTAVAKYQKIGQKNLEGTWLLNLPYKIGITGALVAAFGSFPMVFDLGTATWFNEFYVTTDLPDARDLETPLEVGAWTWNVSMLLWGATGQSKVLLCCNSSSPSTFDLRRSYFFICYSGWNHLLVKSPSFYFVSNT